MTSTSHHRSSILSPQNLVLLALIWAVAALLFFLLFSVTPEGDELPLWYSIGTYIFELGAFFMAFLACYRNWNSAQMVSGQSVWLGIGLGALSYTVGGILFGVWELVWGLDPVGSPADFLYVLSYTFLGWGIGSAILSKRLNLQLWQWFALAGVAIAATALAVWITDPSFFGLLGEAEVPTRATQISQVQLAQATPGGEAIPTPDVITPLIEDPQEVLYEESSAPVWVLALDRVIKPFDYAFNLFYVVADVVLLVLATALILSFWGGRFSQSWRMIAFAIICLYVADTYAKWADTTLAANYESGGLLEVFFVFSGILLAIGAVLEYDISTRSRQSRRSRRSSAKS